MQSDDVRNGVLPTIIDNNGAIGVKTFCQVINGRPIYQRLILDQGYWKDSHLTPPSEEALIEDIDKIHAL